MAVGRQFGVTDLLELSDSAICSKYDREERHLSSNQASICLQFVVIHWLIRNVLIGEREAPLSCNKVSEIKIN